MFEGSRTEPTPGDLAPRRESTIAGPEDTQNLPVVEPTPKTERGMLWDIVETLLLALLVFVAVRAIVLNFRVDGESMSPNLDSGEMLLVNRAIYWHFDVNGILDALPFVDRSGSQIVYPLHPPQRGDIVVLHPPVDRGKPYIKRVIGLPGERLSIHDGAVYINGQRLEEPYLHGVSTSWAGTLGQQEITIPDGQVYVLGDNRANSSDSRAFGPIAIDQIIGRAWIAYWPGDDIGILSTPSYPR
ncbi:MAG TPA: signal peptidase I [Thermomicrobiales bacterium]|mgnify:CR=1 FL=1|jgi:signal peptidase I|nr:signal peptidase I [Chloroflexota bacterium]HBY45345.1 signal peptidase I [Chloroflexota bacterium]HQZ88816.1 signal peptidase I [Thermomicrobiales bacterium]HRA32314.1 signal peptidase I [Thermomicrobiales bacterium]